MVPLDGKAGKSLPFRLIFRGIGESEFFSKKVKKGVDKPNGICYNQTRRRTKGENLDPYGSIAQLGEHLPYKQRVIGSSPIVPTIYGPVVQLVRTLACHARGQGFESPSGRQQHGVG